MGVESLLSLGSQKMKKHIMKCSLARKALYMFTGASLPACCQTEASWQLSTDIIACGAYPGPNGVWQATNQLSEEKVEILRAFAQAGFVEEKRHNGFAVSDLGLRHVHRTRPTFDHALVFKPRVHLALAQRTTWQLIDGLMSEGWKLLQMPRRRQLPPIDLSQAGRIVGHIYYNSKLELCHDYVRVLSSCRALCDHGFTELKHKMQAGYYKQMLQCVDSGTSMPAALRDLRPFLFVFCSFDLLRFAMALRTAA